MKNSKNYHDEMNKENVLKLRRLMEELPEFCRQFFRGIEHVPLSRTRLAYAYDLGVFFNFCTAEIRRSPKWKSPNFPCRFWIRLQKAILKNIWSTSPIIKRGKRIYKR